MVTLWGFVVVVVAAAAAVVAVVVRENHCTVPVLETLSWTLLSIPSTWQLCSFL